MSPVHGLEANDLQVYHLYTYPNLGAKCDSVDLLFSSWLCHFPCLISVPLCGGNADDSSSSCCSAAKFLLGLFLYEDNPHLNSFIADHGHEMSFCGAQHMCWLAPLNLAAFRCCRATLPRKICASRRLTVRPRPSQLAHHEWLQRDQPGPPVDEIGLTMISQLP
jgi:hypothetical protein